MKLTNTAIYQQVVQKLQAAYAQDGRTALAKMTLTEQHVLYAETTMALNDTSKHLAKFGHDEVSQHKITLLEAQVADIAGYMKRKRGPNEPEMER